jgi:hypothetical protein
VLEAVAFQPSEDASNRWRKRSEAARDGETQAVCLTASVIWVLPDDYHLRFGASRELECPKDLRWWRKDIVSLSGDQAQQVSQPMTRNAVASTGTRRTGSDREDPAIPSVFQRMLSDRKETS